jgi:hypothetical protein
VRWDDTPAQLPEGGYIAVDWHSSVIQELLVDHAGHEMGEHASVGECERSRLGPEIPLSTCFGKFSETELFEDMVRARI